MAWSLVSTAPPFRKEGKMAGVSSDMLVSSCKTTQNHNVDQPVIFISECHPCCILHVTGYTVGSCCISECKWRWSTTITWWFYKWLNLVLLWRTCQENRACRSSVANPALDGLVQLLGVAWILLLNFTFIRCPTILFSSFFNLLKPSGFFTFH